MVEAQRTHPLQDRLYAGNGVAVTPVKFHDRVSLRADKEAIAGLGKAIGVALPKDIRTANTKDEVSALWIGPDEWFVIGPQGTGLEEKLNKVKSGLFSVVPIGHRNTGMFVSGKNAVAVLNAGCPQDLSLDAFPISACTRTIMGKAEIILWRKDEHRFHVECWRSFSNYVWKHLTEAARCI